MDELISELTQLVDELKTVKKDKLKYYEKNAAVHNEKIFQYTKRIKEIREYIAELDVKGRR